MEWEIRNEQNIIPIPGRPANQTASAARWAAEASFGRDREIELGLPCGEDNLSTPIRFGDLAACQTAGSLD